MDADWAGDTSDSRSTLGFMFLLGNRAISWSSKKRPTVALLSTVAEYRGATAAACEAVSHKRLLTDFNKSVIEPMPIHCDNFTIIQLAKNPVFHAQTKHIELYYHYICEWILAGDINLHYIDANELVANIFTKALGLDNSWWI